MDRSAKNSVSFGKKLSYCRGSAYCISIVEKYERFKSYPLPKKIKTIINYWRYCIHGDIKFFKAKNMFEITRNNWLYTILYIFSCVISLIDIASSKVEKTHIEFERNIRNNKIEIDKLH